MHVVVAGAGLAGLAATVALRQRGLEVTLLERSRLLGGKATSFTVDGIEVDNGQHVHLGCCSAYLDFIESLAPGDGMLWTQPRFEVLVLRAGRAPARLRAAPLPAPLHLLGSFLRFSPLPLRAKLDVARALRAARRPGAPGQSFGEWLRCQRQSVAALDGFWKLFVVPALNAPLDEVDVEAARFVINTAFGGDRDAARIGWARVPLAQLAAAAAARASRVRLRTAAVGLLDHGDRVSGVRCSDGTTVDADAVILAVPPERALALLDDVPGHGVDGLASFATRPIVDVHLWFDTGSVGFGFAALMDSPVQWVFEKRPGYLCCSISDAGSLVTLPEAELVELCHRELIAAWPPLASVRLRRGAVTRDPQATFVPSPGLRRPPVTTSRCNLAVAGAWTDTGWPATMESAVRSGRAAAAAIAAGISRLAPSPPEPAHA